MSNRKILYFRIESLCAIQDLTAQPSIEDP